MEILELDNNNLKAITSMGILESLDGEYKSGLLYLYKARELQPEDPKILFNIGNVYLKEKNYFKAIEFFKNSLQYDPENIKTSESLMISQLKIEKWDDLISTCKRVLQVDNSNTKAIALLAKSLKENKKFKDLENFLRKIEKKADLLEQKHLSGSTSINAELLDEDVISNIRKLKLKIKKKLKDLKKSKLIYHKLDLPDDVRECPYINGTSTINNGKNFEIELNDDINNNNLNDSVDDPNIHFDILKTDEMNSDAIFNLGTYFYRKKEYSTALEKFKMLIDTDYQNLSSVYMKIGDIYYTYFKDMSTALENYFISIAKNKTDICFIKIGRCYAFMNNDEKEIEFYRKALDYNPDQDWANFYLGSALARKGRSPHSLKYLKNAFEINNTNVQFIVRYCEELSMSKNKKDFDAAIDILIAILPKTLTVPKIN